MTFDFQLHEVEEDAFMQATDWRSIYDYSYIENIVENIENAEKEIMSSKIQRATIGIAYDSYLYEHYIFGRSILKRDIHICENLKNKCDPHFVWRHSHMLIAWEYLRRSKEYQKDFHHYEEVVSNFLDKFIDIARRHAAIHSCSDNFLRGLKVFGPYGKNYISWKFFNISGEIKGENSIRAFLDNQNTAKEVSTLLDISRRICKKWGLHEWCGPCSPFQKGPPIFLAPQAPDHTARSAEIVGLCKDGEWKHYKNIIDSSSSEDAVIVSFSSGRDIETQLRDTRYLLEKFSKRQGIIFPKINEHDRRDHRLKHKEYIRIIDALNSGINSPSEIGRCIYPNVSAKIGGGRVSKSIDVCYDLMAERYIHIATMPFRK